MLVLGHRGGGQVNNALHTCTAWYAHAAMFSSSISYTHISSQMELVACTTGQPLGGWGGLAQGLGGWLC